MHSDCTFTITDAKGLTIDKGVWRILRVDGEDYVNFSYVAAPGLRTIRAGDVTRTVRSGLDGLRMDIGDDICYLKVEGGHLGSGR